MNSKPKKIVRDRAVLLVCYRELCRTFGVKRSERVSPERLAAMTTEQVYVLCKDLYETAPAEKCLCVARKIGLVPAKPHFTLKYHMQATWARVWLWWFHFKRRIIKYAIRLGDILFHYGIGTGGAFALGIVKNDHVKNGIDGGSDA